MAETDGPVYCARCSKPVQPGDTFCGTCGALIPPDAQDTPSTQEIPTQVPPPPSVPARRGNRTLILGVIGAVLVLSLVAAGAFAALSLDDGREPSGGAEEQPADGNGNSPSQGGDTGDAESASVSPDAPPDPAFDHLLPTLKERTTAPIMLPAELPDEMDKPAIDGYFTGDQYAIVFFFAPHETVVEGWANSEALGILRAYPQEEDQGNEHFDAQRVEEVRLPDGTEATLRYMEPTGQAGAHGPFWEGKFDKNGFTYTLTLTADELTEDEVKQALSTMVEVPASDQGQSAHTANSGSTAPDADVPEDDGSEVALREAVEDYYWAVDREDWDYTYDHLASGTKRQFTRKEWFKKNQWFANHYPQRLASIEVEMDVIEDSAEVTIERHFEDGTSQKRLTYFWYEDDTWKHQFAQEEHELFMPAASYEEFVAAQ